MDVPLYLEPYKLGKTLGIGAFGKVKREFEMQYSELIVFV